MAKKTNYSFRSKDDRGTRINAVKWESETEKPRAVLQLIHGMVEFIERYEEFAEYLTENGFVVMGHDHIGHGGSVGSKADWGIMHTAFPDVTMVEDIYTEYKLIRKKYPDLPHFILGHSMGSYLLREFLSMKTCDLFDLSGAIIMGTGFSDEKTCRLGLWINKFMSRFMGRDHKSLLFTSLMFTGSYKRYDMTGKDPGNSWLTKDTDIVRKYYEEPRNNFLFSLNGYKGLISAVYFDLNPSAAANIQKELPVIFVSGADDPVGDFGKGVRKAYNLFKRAGISDVSIKLYENDRHEILNETDRKKVFADILGWMKAHMQGN